MKHDKKRKGFVDTQNVRGQNGARKKYEAVIRGIAARGVCPFCPQHLRSYHKNPIAEGAQWWVTASMYPYHPVRHHLLLIHKKHIEGVEDVSETAWNELRTLIQKETKRRGIAGGTFMVRFGDTRFTGGSVTHLHAHLIQSDPEHADYTAEKKVAAGVVARVG